MKIIKEISDMIEDEIEGACEYAKRAVELREEMPDLADTLYSISLQEVQHINLLHTQVVHLIEQERKEHGEPPATMMAVYEYLHKKHIEAVNEIKIYQQMYKEK